MSKEHDWPDAQRVIALQGYDVLDTPPEESFDRITRMAKFVLQTPIVLVSLVDTNRQWFKSRQGLDATETPRDISFCTHAIALDEPLIIRDALEDERFRDNPLVLNDPKIRFYIGVPLRTPNGYNIGTLCAIDQKPRDLSPDQITVMKDLARIVVDELELRQIATTDCLTGAMTRRRFDLESRKELERAKRYGKSLSLIAFDLDHFKSINDTYGHAAGDLVLHKVIAACNDSLRAADSLARIGGEEFAILLPETDQQSAIETSERLRQVIEGLPITDNGRSITVTASFGVAVHAGDDRDVEATLRRADAALYQAKQNGRNRTECFGTGADYSAVA